MHKFSDFAKGSQRLEGAQTHIADILNKEIVVRAFDIFDSVKNPGRKACAIQFSYPGSDSLYVVRTGGKVLISQAQEYQEQLPFIATVIKRQVADGKSYYTFS